MLTEMWVTPGTSVTTHRLGLPKASKKPAHFQSSIAGTLQMRARFLNRMLVVAKLADGHMCAVPTNRSNTNRFDKQSNIYIDYMNVCEQSAGDGGRHLFLGASHAPAPPTGAQKSW